eukprot:3532644-Rhodomonas_salina.1
MQRCYRHCRKVSESDMIILGFAHCSGPRRPEMSAFAPQFTGFPCPAPLTRVPRMARIIMTQAISDSESLVYLSSTTQWQTAMITLLGSA